VKFVQTYLPALHMPWLLVAVVRATARAASEGCGPSSESALRVFGGRFAWYSAADFGSWEERGWRLDTALQGGLVTRGSGRTYRILLELLDGRPQLGESFSDTETSLALGTCLFVGCSVGRTTIARMVPPAVPFFIAMTVIEPTAACPEDHVANTRVACRAQCRGSRS
jgi:hypothetical protein